MHRLRTVTAPLQPAWKRCAATRVGGSFSQSRSLSTAARASTSYANHALGALALGGLGGSVLLLHDTVHAEELPKGPANPAVGGALDALESKAGAGDKPKKKKKKIVKKVIRRRKKKKGKKKLPQPGKCEDVNSECKGVVDVNTFGGCRFSIGKGVFPQQPNPSMQEKQVVLNIDTHMGDPQGGNTVSFSVNTQLGTEHIFNGRSSGGRTNGVWLYSPKAAIPGLGATCTAKSSFQIVPDQPQYNMICTEVDLKGDIYQGTLTYMKGQKQVYGLAYLQSVTPTIALGIMGMHNYPETTCNYVARYKKDYAGGKKSHKVVLSYADMGMLSASYARKVSESLTLATEMQYQTGSHESVVNVGMRYSRPTFMFSGGIDSQGRVSSSLDQIVMSIIRFSLAGEITHGTKDAQFGFGVSINLP